MSCRRTCVQTVRRQFANITFYKLRMCKCAQCAILSQFLGLGWPVKPMRLASTPRSTTIIGASLSEPHLGTHSGCTLCHIIIIRLTGYCIFNPRRACAARVTLCVCVCVCLSSLISDLARIHVQQEIPTASALHG